MDTPLTLGIVAVAVSVLAAAIAAVIAVRQVRQMRHANYIPLVTELISEFRSRQLYDDLVYVTTRLNIDHEPSEGISGLPDEVRAAVLNVAYYYQAFAWLIGLDILKDEADMIAIYQARILLTWPAIEPYVKVERTNVSGPILTKLEHTYDTLALPLTTDSKAL